MKKSLCIVLMCFIAAAASGVDYGVVLGGDGEYAEALNPEGFSFTGSLRPWFSAVFTEKIDMYVSGRMAFEYREERDPAGSCFFEPERTEINFRPGSAVYVTLGRQRFQDAAALIASGLFDGAGGSVKLGICRLSLGAFYTGLLFKETSKIILTRSDLDRYEKPRDSGGLDGYFASRRTLLALTGEFPDLTARTSLTAQVLAQFDVNGDSDALHTQYLELRFAAEPADPLHVHLGGVGELAQGPDDVQGSAAVFAGADWEVPGASTDMLSAEFLWSGGKTEDRVRAFTPVSGKNAGRVFGAGTGALMKAGLSYRGRLLAGFSVEAGTAYFIRTDLETLRDRELDDSSKSRTLGGELYGSLAWAPDPAFRISAGGGAFFPGWGGAFREEAPLRWKANLGLILSL
jgi:hypothetical protein